MRILAIHSGNNPDQNKRSGVDAWRLGRPIAELRKHVDWTIDERHTVIPDIESYTNATEFTEVELDKAFKDLCSYDIVISTYQSNPTIHSLLMVAQNRSNMQYILDVDDDMFAINPDNPVWLAVKDEQIYHMQRMIADVSWLSTTTQVLKDVFVPRRPDHRPSSVFVNPNYISDSYAHPPVDNGDNLVIGFFGGSSHYGDLHRTGVLEAIQKIMHEHRNVRFKSVGIPIDTYLPRARYELGEAKKGDAWLNDIYPNLNMDIAIAPLEDNIFNRSKSNIKWQEATRAGAAFVCSNVGPYKDLKLSTAWHVYRNTTEDWYRTLKMLVEVPYHRENSLAAARTELAKNWRLEDHWQQYRDMFQTVYDSAHGKINAKELTTRATSSK